MAADELEIDLNDLQRRMDGAQAALRSEFATLRTGRASGAMLDQISVNAYGAMMPLNQCATINVPEPRMLTVNVWDKTLIGAVEKALRTSGRFTVRLAIWGSISLNSMNCIFSWPSHIPTCKNSLIPQAN